MLASSRRAPVNNACDGTVRPVHSWPRWSNLRGCGTRRPAIRRGVSHLATHGVAMHLRSDDHHWGTLAKAFSVIGTLVKVHAHLLLAK